MDPYTNAAAMRAADSDFAPNDWASNGDLPPGCYWDAHDMLAFDPDADGE